MPAIYLVGVEHQIQLNKRACWFTCLQMAVKYYENKNQSSTSSLSSPEYFPYMQKRFAAGSNPAWAEWRQWAQDCGFTPLNMSANEHGIYQIISTSGPIIYSGTWGNTFDGHVVILIGVDTEKKILYVDDPLEPSAPVVKNIDQYFAELAQTLWENPLFIYS
jgi:hypothetical protein